jgi:hypothetical protein
VRIIRSVIIKQVLTEKSKAKLLENFYQTKRQLIKECEQLRFNAKKTTNNKKYSPYKAHAYFTKEIDSREEKIKLIDFQIEQVQMLPLGSELKEKEIQGIADVNIGDNWEEVSSDKIIVIKDGIIEDIR